MKLEIILALVLVTTSTLSSAHFLYKRETLQDVDEEENEGEPTPTPAAPTQNEGESEAGNLESEAGSPAAQLKRVETPGEDKRGTGELESLPITEPCTGWVDRFFKQYLLMNDNDRDEVEFTDLLRFFLALDLDGDGRISIQEFGPKWMEATGFGEADTITIFARYFALLGPVMNPEYITPENVDEIWMDMLLSDDLEGSVTMEYLTEHLKDILTLLPNKGCSVDRKPGDAQEVDFAIFEKPTTPPDVYVYFKRKRK